MELADLTLTGGPNNPSAEVLAALGAPILYHYDPVFMERFRATERQIARIFQTTSHDIILMQGEAVLGLEAAARAVVAPGMACLNLVSGVFGKGFGYWLTAIGAELHEIEVGYNEAIDPAAVDAYLDAHPEIRMCPWSTRRRPPARSTRSARSAHRARPRRGDHRGLRVVLRRHRTRIGGVAAGPARSRPAEMPRWPSWDVVDGRQ